MLSSEKGQQFINELIMEYIKQNNILCCKKENIPEQIDEIIEVGNIITGCVEKKIKEVKFL